MGFLKKMGNSLKNPKKAASIVFNKIDEGAGKKIFKNPIHLKFGGALSDIIFVLNL